MIWEADTVIIRFYHITQISRGMTWTSYVRKGSKYSEAGVLDFSGDQLQ